MGYGLFSCGTEEWTSFRGFEGEEGVCSKMEASHLTLARDWLPDSKARQPEQGSSAPHVGSE